MNEISGDQEEEIPQEVEIVNGLLKKSFGEGIQGGNFRNRGIIVGESDPIPELKIVLDGNKEFVYFEKANGEDICDGSCLVIYGGKPMSLLRRSDRREYERLYLEKFGKEATVRFEKRR
jgi:hypothetical protein